MLKSILSKWTKPKQHTESIVDNTAVDDNDVYSDHLTHNAGTVGFIDMYSQEYIYKNVLANIPENDSIIDYGCGRGDLYGAMLQQERDVSLYTGIEYSTILADVGKSKYPNIDIRVENWFTTPSDIIKDWAVSISSFDVIYQPEQAVNTYGYICNTIENMLMHSNKGAIITFLRYDQDAIKRNILTYNIGIIHDRILSNRNFIVDATSVPDTIKLIIFKDTI